MITYIIIRAVVVKGGIAYGSICNCHLDKVQQVWLQREDQKVIKKHDSSIRQCSTKAKMKLFVFAFAQRFRDNNFRLFAKIACKNCSKITKVCGSLGKKFRANLTIPEVFYCQQHMQHRDHISKTF
jgi:hypothetical protein